MEIGIPEGGQIGGGYGGRMTLAGGVQRLKDGMQNMIQVFSRTVRRRIIRMPPCIHADSFALFMLGAQQVYGTLML